MGVHTLVCVCTKVEDMQRHATHQALTYRYEKNSTWKPLTCRTSLFPRISRLLINLMWVCVCTRRLAKEYRWIIQIYRNVYAQMFKKMGVFLHAHFKQTEDSLWYNCVPQGTGIWHIVFVGNSNHLQLSTCFDPSTRFHFPRSSGELLQRSLWKENPHYGFSVSGKNWLEGQCHSHHWSFPLLRNNEH